MQRRDFLPTAGGAAAAPLVFVRRATAQGPESREAKLARIAGMSLTFANVIRLPGAHENPACPLYRLGAND